MKEPLMAEVDELYNSRTRSIECENKRQNEIRRLAREALMREDLRDLTKSEALSRVVRRAIMVYDDVEQLHIPKKRENRCDP